MSEKIKIKFLQKECYLYLKIENAEILNYLNNILQKINTKRKFINNNISKIERKIRKEELLHQNRAFKIKIEKTIQNILDMDYEAEMNKIFGSFEGFNSIHRL